MSWWNDGLLSADLAVLLDEVIMSFRLLPEIVKLYYFLD